MQHIIEEAVRRIPSEPYPELHLVLDTFVTGVQNALKENFVGAYLIGSLATGDFDLDSDIDFLVVTSDEMTDAELQLLAGVVYRNPQPWLKWSGINETEQHDYGGRCARLRRARTCDCRWRFGRSG